MIQLACMPSQQSRSHYDRKNLMASDSTLFDVIVVGAGVEGSATAYQLIKNGAKRVLLLEQVGIDSVLYKSNYSSNYIYGSLK